MEDYAYPAITMTPTVMTYNINLLATFQVIIKHIVVTYRRVVHIGLRNREHRRHREYHKHE